MRLRLAVLACAVAGMVVGSSVAASAECSYKGDGNALPTSGQPVLVYANGDQSPSGFVGVSDGSGDNYGQVSGDASGVQFEGKSTSAGQSGYANSSGGTGSC